MESIRAEDIAVVGLSGRFPGASTLEQFWTNCCEGKETIKHFSADELTAAGVNQDTLAQPNYIRSKGILDNVHYFDADFFGISEQDAKVLDPQQRLFLQCAWEALVDAGYVPKQQSHSRVGVFASTGMSLYLINNILKNPQLLQNLDEYQVLLGNDKDFLATRVSYLLNLKGPSMAIQTGCSSSLVCIHYAVQSLLNGECDMAIAGGVSITIPQEQGYFYRKEMIGSADGHCYAFDKRAQGTVKSNGVGVVALKLLSDALADNDSIYAVIRGSAVNNDGAQKVGFTAPNALQQTSVIKEALNVAQVSVDSIAYIETHGTGTLLGDPIELSALKNAFGQALDTDNKQCALASLKTNIGHLDVAAGVAGFIKVCLAIHHKKIPASLNFSDLNPKISLENSPFYINVSLRDWPNSQPVRVAGISAFGVGGTNAHIILQQAPEGTKQKPWTTPAWNLKSYWIEPSQSAFINNSRQTIHGLDLEACMKKAWKHALGSEPLTNEEHFFNQGGHSLAAIHFIEELPQSVRHLVGVVHLYQYPRFYQLLDYIQSHQAVSLDEIKKEAINPEADLFSDAREL